MAPPVGSITTKMPAQAQDSFEATSLISSVAIPEDEERTGKCLEVILGSLKTSALSIF